VIELPRSTYYYRSTAKAAAITDARLVEWIDEIQIEFAGYGYRRVSRELSKRGHCVNHKRVARVMKAHGLGIKPRRRFVRTTDSDHDFPVFPNLYCNVIPAKPDVVWVADITYIRIANGFCFLAAILDACSRKVVGYALSRQIDTELALAALRAAFANQRPAPGACIHHSDRGCQGEFNPSSQHLLIGGVDGYKKAGSGTRRTCEDAVARATSSPTSIGAETVLAGDRRWMLKRGRSA
jgi:putative transposase